MVLTIQRNYRHSKIVVQGDLNAKWMSSVKEFLEIRGIRPVFEGSTATHDRGGHLGQVFTNLKVKSKLVPLELSEHASLSMVLRFQKTDLDLDLRCIPTLITQK
jgi:hypothetical protein